MRVALVILFSLIWFNVLSQSTSEPEIKYAYRYDFVDGEFIPVKRTSNSYDHRGYNVSQISSWDAPDWKEPETITTREYNSQGLIIHYSYKYFHEGKVEDKEERFWKYQGSLLILDSVISDWDTRVTRFIYNQNNQITGETYLEYQENGDFRGGRRIRYGHKKHYYWENDSLLYAGATYQWDMQWILQDSMYLDRDDYGDVIFAFYYYNHYYSNPPQTETIQFKYDVERDNLGRKISEIESWFDEDRGEWRPVMRVTSEYPDYSTLLTTRFQYDLVNFQWIPESEYSRKIEYLQNIRRETSTFTDFGDGSQTRDIQEYVNNILIRWHYLSKQITDTEWLMVMNLTWEYDKLLRPISSEFYYYSGEDKDLAYPYERYTLSEYRYDNFEDWVYYREYKHIYDPYEENYSETDRIRYRTFRCDGALMEDNWTWQTGSYFDQGKYTYEYYQDSWCDPQPAETSEILIFPNPATEYAKFILPEPSEQTQIRVTDSSGKIRNIFTLLKSDYFTLDLGGFSPGVYIVTADNGIRRFQSRLAVVK